MKFKIGDEVRVVASYATKRTGEVGIVTNITPHDRPSPFAVEFNDRETIKFKEDELELVTPITKDGLQDGDKVTLICNDEYIVYNEYLLNSVSCLDLDDYDKDLTCVYGSQNVKQVTRNGVIVFKREEKTFYIDYPENNYSHIECENIEQVLIEVEILLKKNVNKIEIEVK